MTQIKVNHKYEVLLLLLKKEMHGRELTKELKTSLTRIQAILNELREYNVLDYKVEGKNHIYFIKKNLVAKSFILNAENYKFAKLLRKYQTLEPLFKDLVEKYSNRMIVLFGSYAKFIPKEDSDIDIYLDTTDKKIKENLQMISDRLSIKIGKFNPDDLLIKEIIKNHIIIQGGEEFYERLGFFE
jgi:predicted nucleotidyltransferase